VRSLLGSRIVRGDTLQPGSIMNRSPILAAVLLCVAGSNSSIAQDTATSAQSTAAAKEFVEKAGQSGLAEVEMGELGAQKATNGQVKAFAKRMVADHKKANEELETLVTGKALQGKGLQIPSSRSDMHKAAMEKFHQQDAGKGFDRAYMEQMVEDHKTDVELFETAADNERLDPNLSGYAKRILPTLRDHLNQAQTIESKLSD
jgi:putative membrane protein